MSILVDSPWLAAVIALALWTVWKWRRRRLSIVASALWASYCLYEHLMHTRVLCSGECNIRIDLLVIYPVIGAVTIAAIVQSLSARPVADPLIPSDH